MRSIFDEEDEVEYDQLIPLVRRAPSKSIVVRSPPPQQFTRADIRKIPTSETLWGGRTTLPLTKRERMILKLRALRGVMY